MTIFPPTHMSGEPSIVASGNVQVHQFTGGSSSGSETVKMSGLADGRLVLENLKTDYNGGEDVVMTPDAHGGFLGATSKGEWSMSPSDKHGVRELGFAPFEATTPIVKYTFGHPQPGRDLAGKHGTTVSLKPEEGLGLDEDTRAMAPLKVKVEVSGDSLGLRMPDGSVKQLNHRLETGQFADAADIYQSTATATFDAAKGVYQVRVTSPEAAFSGEIAGAAKGDRKLPEEMLASIKQRDEVSSARASLATLPKGQLMVRLSSANHYLPSAIYFDAKTGKGEVADGAKASISKPDAKGVRTVKYETEHGVTTTLKLAPYDDGKAVAQFAGKTAKMTIMAPKSYESNGTPSNEMVEKTFKLTFGKAAAGGSSVPVKIEGIAWPDDMVIHPTEQGGFTINLNNARLWVHPTGDGTMEAKAEWSFQGQMEKGTFKLSQ